MSKPIEGNHRDYSNFDNMSTEALENILRSDSQLPSYETSDMDAILYIMEVIANREKENPTGKFTDIHTSWASFKGNYLPYAKDDKSLYDFNDCEKQSVLEQPYLKRSLFRQRRRLMRAASIVIVFAVLLLAGTITAKALGFDLWNTVAKWTRDTFGFSSSIPESQESHDLNGQIEYKSLQEALDSYGITAKLTPIWLPDGYALQNININSTPVQTSFIADYKSSSNSEIIISITSFTNPQFQTYEKDDENLTVYSVQGFKYYIMSNVERRNIIWQTENCECSISGNFSLDEAKKIIDSIYGRDTT